MTPDKIAELLAELSTPERERLARAICQDAWLDDITCVRNQTGHTPDPTIVCIRALMREREER